MLTLASCGTVGDTYGNYPTQNGTRYPSNGRVYRAPDGGTYRSDDVYRDRNGNVYRNGQVIRTGDVAGRPGILSGGTWGGYGNNNPQNLPPGQAKKVYGGRAKDYAPGQVKKQNGGYYGTHRDYDDDDRWKNRERHDDRKYKAEKYKGKGKKK